MLRELSGQDQSGNGSISPSELQLLELVDGAGSLEDLDRLRIWLCDWKARRAKAAEGSLGEETEEVLTARAIEARWEAGEKLEKGGFQ